MTESWEMILQQCGSGDCFQERGYNDEPTASMLHKEGARKLNGERGSSGGNGLAVWVYLQTFWEGDTRWKEQEQGRLVVEQ